MARTEVSEVIVSNLLEHPAAVAWSRIAPAHLQPRGITVLKSHGHSWVYRLEGAGPRGAAVVAKRSRPEFAETERTIYEDILPALNASMLEVYGYLRGDDESVDGHAWLFLEDACGENYSYAMEKHRALSGRWLGAMHASAAVYPVPASLPSRGPAYYLETLRTVNGAIQSCFSNPALNADHLRTLKAALRQFGGLESHWDQIEALCDRMPQVLVHGDLGTQNAFITGLDRDGLVILDWEFAGWGVPAIDLAQFAAHSLSPDLAAYSPAASPCWTEITNLDRAAAIGSIFRFIVSASWLRKNLVSPWVDRPVAQMNFYRAALAATMRNLDWGTGHRV